LPIRRRSKTGSSLARLQLLVCTLLVSTFAPSTLTLLQCFLPGATLVPVSSTSDLQLPSTLTLLWCFSPGVTLSPVSSASEIAIIVVLTSSHGLLGLGLLRNRQPAQNQLLEWGVCCFPIGMASDNC